METGGLNSGVTRFLLANSGFRGALSSLIYSATWVYCSRLSTLGDGVVGLGGNVDCPRKSGDDPPCIIRDHDPVNGDPA